MLILWKVYKLNRESLSRFASHQEKAHLVSKLHDQVSEAIREIKTQRRGKEAIVKAPGFLGYKLRGFVLFCFILLKLVLFLFVLKIMFKSILKFLLVFMLVLVLMFLLILIWPLVLLL